VDWLLPSPSWLRAGIRFYAKAIAALITAKGREILQKTVDLTQDKLGLDVIYGKCSILCLPPGGRRDHARGWDGESFVEAGTTS
jgi:DNA polymerase elongation subunit (family B)